MTPASAASTRATTAFDQFAPGGAQDTAAETGYDGRALGGITDGPPFNRPTNPAVAPSGDLYVSAGDGNCKIRHLSAGGDRSRLRALVIILPEAWPSQS